MLEVCFTLFFAFLAQPIFQNTSEEASGAPFDTYWQSAWNLFTLLTTANFPDVMMPAYAQCRWFVLFFIIFLLFGKFYLDAIFLSSVWEEYNTKLKSIKDSYIKIRIKGLQSAFRCIVESPFYAPRQGLPPLTRALSTNAVVLDKESTQEALLESDETKQGVQNHTLTIFSSCVYLTLRSRSTSENKRVQQKS